MKKWILGIYRRRLFDEKIEEESNSVVNQKKLIDDYLVDKDDIMIYRECQENCVSSFNKSNIY